jgi:hypothetical protein
MLLLLPGIREAEPVEAVELPEFAMATAPPVVCGATVNVWLEFLIQ